MLALQKRTTISLQPNNAYCILQWCYTTPLPWITKDHSILSLPPALHIIGTKSGVVKIISTFDKDQPKHLKAQLQKSVQRVDLQDVVVSQTSAFVVLTHCSSYSVFRLLHSAQTNLFRCLFQCWHCITPRLKLPYCVNDFVFWLWLAWMQSH